MAYPNYDYDRLKKIAIELSSWVLAISASMILGLLSFSGMLAIWPILSFAFAAFIFAIIIEGQIYIDNIRSSLEKLTNPKAYEHQLIGLYLQEKLSEYDKNRDLLLMREPNAEDIRCVLEHNRVIIFEQNKQYKIGFRNPLGKYECKDLNKTQTSFLDHYSKQEQFLEIPGHHDDEIQKILKTFHADIKPRPLIDYPLFIRAYVSQCQYVRQLNCYTHTQQYNAAIQTDLQNMEQHLTHLDDDMCQHLFHGTSLTSGVDKALKVAAFKSAKTKNEEYHIDLSQMTIELKAKPLIPNHPGLFTYANKKVHINITKDNQIVSRSPWEDFKDLKENHPTLNTISEKYYYFHKNELIKWMMVDRSAWKQKLASHIVYSRLAFIVSSLSGLIMGIGTTYLVMEAVASVPWLATIPLALFPPVIGPLAFLAGIAYGLLIYNSLTDMLLDNPLTKFVNRMRSISWQEDMSFKRKLILSLTALLFAVTIFLTICTAGTWLTVFHKTKPLFQWLSIIPNTLLNLVIPILIGISILPFSIQSIANTLEGLETNPNLDKAIAALNPNNWQAPTAATSHTWSGAWTNLSNSIWQRWIPWFLCVTAEEFAQETSMQKWNPYRIVYRALFEPLRYFIFIGHLISAGATSDQIEGVPLVYSFWLNFGFECAEDWDWIWGRTHVDSIDTVDLLKERVQKSDDHNHDNNFPMLLLKFIFEPIIRRAAQWENHYRPEGAEDNVQKKYARLQGLKPQIAVPETPNYRKSTKFELFLFKSNVYESSVSLSDACVIHKLR